LNHLTCKRCGFLVFKKLDESYICDSCGQQYFFDKQEVFLESLETEKKTSSSWFDYIISVFAILLVVSYIFAVIIIFIGLFLNFTSLIVGGVAIIMITSFIVWLSDGKSAKDVLRRWLIFFTIVIALLLLFYFIGISSS
jgi:hypothetical protein